MNKIKMGRYLKQLRKSKNISQEKLVKLFAEDYLEVSPNAISSWEKGKSIPEINNLNFLAKYYGVTVDDILDGETFENIDYGKKYHIYDSDYFYDDIIHPKSSKNRHNLPKEYRSLPNEGEMVRLRTKNLIMNFINESLSRNDLAELTFLLKNCYLFDEDLNIQTYFRDLKKLRNRNLTNEEKWWEAQKDINPLGYYCLTFGAIADEDFHKQSVKTRMKYTEEWEKDALLASIQVEDPVYLDLYQVNSKYLERYKKEHGKEFDREQIIKDTIRYLINNGAKINRHFLSFQAGNVNTTRVIDTLEKSYNTLVEPIKISITKNGKEEFYYVENNRRNRFFVDCEFDLIYPLSKLGYSYDEIFKMVAENETIPDDVYIRTAKLRGLDINRDIKVIKADLSQDIDIRTIDIKWNHYRYEEYHKNIEEADNLEIFSKELHDHKFLHSVIERHLVGGSNALEKYDYILEKKKKMSLDDFKKGRQLDKTKELLNSLDILSVEEIRAKFFQIGGLDNDKRN